MPHRFQLIKWYTALGFSLGMHAVGYWWIVGTFDFKPSSPERADFSAWLVPLSNTQIASLKSNHPQIAKPQALEQSSILSPLATPNQSVQADSQRKKVDKSIIDPTPVVALDLSFPDYATSNRLDQPPIPLADIDPIYPDGGLGQQGTVLLRLLINEQGNVEKAVVLDSFPKEIFDQAASTAFEKAKFSPGRLLGIPVKAQLTIEIKFTPLNRGSSVNGNRR